MGPEIVHAESHGPRCRFRGDAKSDPICTAGATEAVQQEQGIWTGQQMPGSPLGGPRFESEVSTDPELGCGGSRGVSTRGRSKMQVPQAG